MNNDQNINRRSVKHWLQLLGVPPLFPCSNLALNVTILVNHFDEYSV